MQFVVGTAVDGDGNVLVVGRTPNSTDPFSLSAPNSDVFVGKLSADGSTTLCSMTFGGSGNEIPRATALLSDGTVLIAGLTYSPDFPRVPNDVLPNPDQALTFLTRVDPCQGKILLSTYLLGQPFSLAVGADGTIYVALLPVSGGDTGLIERISVAGSQLATVPVRGTPYAIATDTSGSVYVSGLGVRFTDNNNRPAWKGFATKFSGDLKTLVYDADIGEGRIALGTGLMTAADGTLYIAGAGTQPGADVVDLLYGDGDNDVLPSFDASAAILFAVRSDGTVAFTRYAALATPSLYYSQQRSLGVGLGPDGRIWLAVTGTLNYPLNLDGVPMNGIQLMAFDQSGTPAGGNSFVGGEPFRGAAAAAFGTNGRISTVTLNALAVGSSTLAAAGPMTVIAFDLVGAAAAPALQADRDILDIDEIHLMGSSYVQRDSKSVNVFLSDGSSAAFTANVVFGADLGIPPTSPPLPFSSTADQTLPGSITVSAVPDVQTFSPSAALVVLAPGAQGALTIPVRIRSRNFSLEFQQLDSLVFPTISSQPASFGLALSVDEATSAGTLNSGASLNLPFKLTSQSPRVTFDLSEGTTPAQINAVIDPSGLAPGTYNADVSIDIGGSTQTRTLSWRIGPTIKLIIPEIH